MASRWKEPGARTRCRSLMCAENPEHLQMLEELDEELQTGRAVRQGRTVPAGSGGARSDRRPAHGHESARQRRHAAASRWCCPIFANYAVKTGDGRTRKPRACSANFLRDVMKSNLKARNFRLFGPDETASNRLEAVYEVTGKEWMARDADRSTKI